MINWLISKFDNWWLGQIKIGFVDDYVYKKLYRPHPNYAYGFYEFKGWVAVPRESQA